MLTTMRPMGFATNRQASRQLLCSQYHRSSKLRVRAEISVSPTSSHQQPSSVHISLSPAQHAATQSSTDKHGGSSLIPVALAGAAIVGVLYQAWRRFSGSGSSEYGRGSSNSYSSAMKNINTVDMETLSNEQIDAARQRRSMERANHKLDLDDVELPPNHPFATRQPMTQEDLDLVRARLKVRRSTPPIPGSQGSDRAGRAQKFSDPGAQQ